MFISKSSNLWIANFVAEQCQMTDLGCWTILHAQTLVSHQVLCLGKREYWEKEQQKICAVTWQSISSVAWQAAAQSSHQCQWEDPFHVIEQETKGVAQAESKNPFSNQESGAYCDIWCYWQSTNFVFHRVIYLQERLANKWPGESKWVFFVFSECDSHEN